MRSAFGWTDARYRKVLLRIFADCRWQDAVQFNVINDFNAQGAYGTRNSRAGYAGAGKRWEVALFGTNLAGRQHAGTGGSVAVPASPPAVSWQIPGAPRRYDVEVTHRVGAPAGSRR